ncbi:hypothetical protein OG21DRAFT_1524062 [Imleria badia]|nr:hypothetical protein OG21DRAFT_1524062 [Imleria badia]
MNLCGLDLSERELLQLASSWPCLDVFIVGEAAPAMQVTLPVQLRVQHPWLHGNPQGHPWNGLDVPEDIEIRVRNSAIEDESVEALAIFFHVAPFPKFHIIFGTQYEDGGQPQEPLQLYFRRWKRIHACNEIMAQPRLHYTTLPWGLSTAEAKQPWMQDEYLHTDETASVMKIPHLSLGRSKSCVTKVLQNTMPHSVFRGFDSWWSHSAEEPQQTTSGSGQRIRRWKWPVGFGVLSGVF